MSLRRELPPTATIVFESILGNTRSIAGAIAEGLGDRVSVTLLPVSAGDARSMPRCDLLVIGAPTHVHSLSSPASRAEAERWALDSGRKLAIEPVRATAGVREWLESGPVTATSYAAFDTRVDMPRVFTGSAAQTITKRLKKQGIRALARPESFLVDKDSQLLPRELERARRWGNRLADAVILARPLAEKG